MVGNTLEKAKRRASIKESEKLSVRRSILKILNRSKKGRVPEDDLDDILFIVAAAIVQLRSSKHV